MFDSIQCNHPLPLPLDIIDLLPDIYEQELQTKDLDCSMDLYILDENGALKKEDRVYKWVDDDSSFLKGYLETVDRKIRDTNFHGIVNFYVYERVYNDDDNTKGKDVSIDFLSKFTDGKLDFVEVLEYSIEDASERILRLKDLHEEHERIRNLWINKYFKNTKPVRYIRNKVVKGLYKLHNFTGKLHTLAIRYI